MRELISDLGFQTRVRPSANRKVNPDWKKGDKIEYFEDGVTIKKDKWLRNEKGEYISDPHYKFKQDLIIRYLNFLNYFIQRI